jgi:hypothetical protein
MVGLGSSCGRGTVRVQQMTVKRYLLLNLGIAALSGILNGPALFLYDRSKSLAQRARCHLRKW